jgi:DNA replication protein DnaC
MTNEDTLEKMKKMHLHGMARSFLASMEIGSGQLTPDELVGMIVDSEYDDRTNKRLERLLLKAKLRYKASIENINFHEKRNLDKNSIIRYASGTWLEKKENILITGPTGSGKSFIACALGNRACLLNYSVLYYGTSKLFKQLKLASVDGSYLKELSKIKKVDLLILDDFGLDVFDKQSRLALLEILEDRIELKSMIIASQLPTQTWYDSIGEKNIADAICDRLLHTAHRIELKGESMRKKIPTT